MSAHRCNGCGRFSAGPFIAAVADSTEYRESEGLIGPCCQSPADRAEGGQQR